MTRTLTLFAGFLLCIVSFQAFAQDYRIVGERCFFYYNNNWVEEDTTELTYSNGRGGDYDGIQTMATKPDTLRYTRWNVNLGTINVGWISTRSYNQQNLLTQDEKLYVSGLHNKVLYTYDINNNNTIQITKVMTNNVWQDDIRQVRAFDMNNNLTSYEYQIWNNNTWESVSKVLYAYSLNNDITSELSLNYNMGSWDSTKLISYHYTNNLQDTLWEKNWQLGTTRTTSIYQNGLLKNTYAHKLDGTDWEPAQRKFLFYQGTGNLFLGDSTQNWDTTALAWNDIQSRMYTLDNNNDVSTILTRIADQQTGIMRNNRWDTIVYNNGHKVIWQKNLYWNPNTNTFAEATFSREKFFYYEQYTNDVEGISINTAKLQVFPSPARSDININVIFNEPQDFKVRIYDMQGRLVLQLGEKATKDYNKNIPLLNLASGNYILQIAGKQTRAEQQFTIIK